VLGDKDGGKGIFIYSNGDKYIGEFKNNLFHGDGIIKQADGKEIKVKVYKNKFISASHHPLLKNNTIPLKYDKDSNVSITNEISL